MWTVRLATCFVPFVLATTPAFAEPPIGVQFHGTWTNYSASERNQVLDTLQANNVHTVRIDVSWAMLQPDGPTISPWGLAKIDTAVAEARAHGMTPLLTLWLTPQWASAGPYNERNAPTTIRGLQAWRAICQFVATRYPDASLELWNEPNDTDFLANSTPQRYAALLRYGYDGVNHRVPVVFGGTSYVDDEFVRAVCAAGGSKSFDILGVNPYMVVADEAPDLPDNGTKYRLNHLPNMIKVLRDYGRPNTPIWFTEFGWPVRPDGPTNWTRGVTPSQQTDYLRRTVKLVQSKYPTVRRMYWYQDRADCQCAASGYGLVFPNGTATPTLRVMQ